ncbi:aquaporin-like protein [Artomyces pyxidatus]|uniref:Aquaporin-like protein n=1 Tax=Artomyces pyxidatus TaxID=48021 RepID=A0ACB8TB40_9AGAM|nr:aquaporin-like protein [Artomyces pyxidatus]
MSYGSDPHHKLHLADIQTRPRFFQSWEKVRHRQAHWLVQCLAESVGLFIVCAASLGSQAAFIIGRILGFQEIGSLFTVGIAFAIGVAVAVIVTTGTSGGHLNPAVTVYFVLFKGMPVRKAARYIAAQIMGAYIGCLIIYVQWHTMIKESEAALIASGTYDAQFFTPSGPAGVFANYATPGAGLFYIWLNEFVIDFFAGLVIFSCLDPTNFLAPPVAMPWIIGLAYAAAVWSGGPVGLAANGARDIGGRLAAITIWGLKASGGRYAAITGLTSIPATLLAAVFYEFVCTDSSRVITAAQKESIFGHRAHMEHQEKGYPAVQTNSTDIEKGSESTDF